MRGSRVLSSALSLVLIAAACSGQPGGAPATDLPAAPGSNPPPAAATAAPTDLPKASLDPAMSAEELLHEDTPASALGLEERSSETRDGASIRDVRFAGSDGRWVAGYVVGPASGDARAGVLFLHWLGEERSSREEFVDEAVALVADGVVSMLIQQRFPWADRPSAVEHDRVAIGYQVRNARRALSLLVDEVGAAPVAIVGHDYGAMHATLVASVDPRPISLVSMAPDAKWVTWFVKYFHSVSASEADAYAAAMADLDPVTRLPNVAMPVFLQFASHDIYVPQSVAEAIGDAAGADAEVRTYETVHALDATAQADRDAWLLDLLAPAT